MKRRQTEPMAVAMANSRVQGELRNAGEEGRRLQPIASRAPNPAMMPPATACAMRIRLRGKRSLTLFAHSAAAAAAEHADDHPAIDAGQRRPFEMYQLVIAHCSLWTPSSCSS